VTDSPAGAAAATEDPTDPLGYTLWAVLRRNPAQRAGTGDLSPALAAVEADGVTLRGFYDVSSIRADADLMVWLHGPAPEKLQAALRTLRRSDPLASLLPTWNVLGVHREAEFNAAHTPAFLRGAPPQRWLTVYPFVRSYDWYLLPADERRAMLADHGRKGASHRRVLSNTVAAFGLGDYEWILALEAPELVELVDLMRHLRETDARRHVREETPFYAGRRIEVDEIAEVLA
jgi:chlorite dismutase